MNVTNQKIVGGFDNNKGATKFMYVIRKNNFIYRVKHVSNRYNFCNLPSMKKKKVGSHIKYFAVSNTLLTM